MSPIASCRLDGLSALKYGKQYVIPKPLDPRVLLWVAPAVAQAAIESGVARRNDIDLEEYEKILIARQGRGRQLRNQIIAKARRGTKKRIVFAEGEESKIIRAAARVKDEGIGEPILMGRPERIHKTIEELGLRFEPEIFGSLCGR